MNDTPDNLKSKTRSSSFKAAAISIAFHVLLAIFAGSIVAVHYIQKQNAEFTVSTSPPKLERRHLQMPAKTEQLRETIRQPKIVSRSVSMSAPSFTAPDMGKLGNTSSQRFSLPAAQAGRDFNAISKRFGSGIPQVEFFGVRAEGEKFIFIIDASPGMLVPETGGLPAYGYIKETLRKTVEKLPAAALYNVILYDGEKIYQFRPQLVPATKENGAALNGWLQPINSDPALRGLTGEQNNYRRPEPYQTAVGSDAANWLLALQSAFEQRADNVFILCADWGKYGLSLEKRRLLRDFSLWELLNGGGPFSIGGSPVLRDDRKLRDDVLKQAVTTIKKNEDVRKSEKRPPEFLHDITAYIEYPAAQILDHTEVVYLAQYAPLRLDRPQVHVIRLISEDKYGVADSFTEYMQQLAHRYNGGFESFSGQEAARKQIEVAATPAGRNPPKPLANMTSSESPSLPDAPSSVVQLLGTGASGARIAFILDASVGMLSEKTGGTNTYAAIKKQLLKAVAELKPGTLFNVIAYDRKQVALFQSQMVPASQSGALSDWLSALNSSAVRSGLRPEQNNYTPLRVYKTAVGEEVRALPRALQAAMEDHADTIFIVSTGIGSQPVSLEKAVRLLDFSIWNLLGGSSGSAGSEGTDEEGNGAGSQGDAATAGGKLQPLQEDVKMTIALMKQTLNRIAAEKKARKDAGLPPDFVPDVLNSIEHTRDQVLAHITTVCNMNYVSQELNAPKIHFLCLQEDRKTPVKETLRDLRGLTEPYEGTVRFFEGSDTTR